MPTVETVESKIVMDSLMLFQTIRFHDCLSSFHLLSYSPSPLNLLSQLTNFIAVIYGVHFGKRSFTFTFFLTLTCSIISFLLKLASCTFCLSLAILEDVITVVAARIMRKATFLNCSFSY